MSLKSYHRAWLEYHPCRTEAWLRERLSEGFHVHHVDRDHANESRENLVLIEAEDHMMIHGIMRFSWRPSRGVRAEKKRLLGPEAYAYRRDNLTWVGWKGCSRPAAFLLARDYARDHGLEWPLPAKQPYPANSNTPLLPATSETAAA